MNKKLLKVLFLSVSIMLLAVEAMAEKSYFAADKIAPTLLDNPLNRASEEYENEVLRIVEMQKAVKEEELKSCREENFLRPEGFVYKVDSRLTRNDFPQLYKLLDRVLYTTSLVAENCKNYWNTKRPFASEKRVKALIEVSNNPSYPSGHTTASYVLARILGQLIPEKSQDFLNRAQEIAYHRILSGMHYPHDIEGGKQLSLIVIGSLMQSREFAADFKLAAREVRK